MADMNRRNVLVGLGTAAAGSGIVFGSGAFTQVEAERDVTIQVAKDADAALNIQDGGNDVTSVDGTSGALVIDSFDEIGTSDGLNPDATAIVEDVFEVENTLDVSVNVEIEITSGTENFDLRKQSGTEGDTVSFTLDAEDGGDPSELIDFTDIDTGDEGSDLSSDITVRSGEFQEPE